MLAEWRMLRITLHDEPGSLTFQFEGKLAGPWVQEAEACWRHALASQRSSTLCIDLAGVTMIDRAGKAFLAAARSQGAKLVASGCVMKAVVAELTGNQHTD